MKDNYEEEDKLFEGFYYHLGKCHAEKTADDLARIEGELSEVAYPKALVDWFSNYLEEHEKRERKNQNKKKLNIFFKSVAMFLVVLTAGIGVTTFSVQAFKIKLFNMVSEITSKYTEIEFVEADENSNEVVKIPWPSYLYPEYLPKGFKLSEVQGLGNTKLIYFIDPSGNTIEISQSSDASSFQVDTEQAETQKIEMTGEEGWLIHKDGFSTLIWKRGELTLYVMGSLSDDELIKIAKSIKWIQK